MSAKMQDCIQKFTFLTYEDISNSNGKIPHLNNTTVINFSGRALNWFPFATNELSIENIFFTINQTLQTPRIHVYFTV